MGLFEELRELMIKYHFRPEKKLSQFFCINEALLVFLTKSANLKKTDVVLEIGPGTGFLTKFLLEKCKVVAIEKDESMFELLSTKFEKEIKSKKLNLILGDALEEDYSKLKINKIVSLPPYHISTDLVNKIIFSDVKKAILVFDTGFLEKIMAFEGFKEYTALTAFLNLNAKVEILEQISKSSFFPRPNCNSAVLKIDFNRIQTSRDYFIFLKELFRHKNKDLSRALKQAIPFLEKELNWNNTKLKHIENLESDDRKIYSLTPKELLNIYEELND